MEKIDANLELKKVGVAAKDFIATKKDMKIENGKLVISNPELVKAIDQQISLQGGSPIMSETGISLTYKF